MSTLPSVHGFASAGPEYLHTGVILCVKRVVNGGLLGKCPVVVPQGGVLRGDGGGLLFSAMGIYSCCCCSELSNNPIPNVFEITQTQTRTRTVKVSHRPSTCRDLYTVVYSDENIF